MDLSVFSKLNQASIPSDFDEKHKITLLVQLREGAPLPDYAKLHSTWHEDNWYRTIVDVYLLEVFEDDPAVLAMEIGKASRG